MPNNIKAKTMKPYLSTKIMKQQGSSLEGMENLPLV
jgi:hypothetical protein